MTNIVNPKIDLDRPLSRGKRETTCPIWISWYKLDNEHAPLKLSSNQIQEYKIKSLIPIRTQSVTISCINIQTCCRTHIALSNYWISIIQILDSRCPVRVSPLMIKLFSLSIPLQANVKRLKRAMVNFKICRRHLGSNIRTVFFNLQTMFDSSFKLSRRK